MLTLALIAGLVAMHHLAGGGHAGHAVLATPLVDAAPLHAAPLHAAPLHAVSAAPHDVPSPPLPTQPEGVASALWPGGSPLPVGPCVAVLLVLVALLLTRRSSGRSTPPLRRLGRPATGSAPPGRGPPRLLLAQLCVLRT